ncbi:hypothetical protein [Rubrivirga sp. IMCC43871]|uniref:hypothetical protein n=1 Tax=Rubrivirga sp. IMCC43871 TaxID=3391575 RepID=UPI00398FA76F
MTDHFSEDDARRIFARAAERQHAVQARGEGLTLAELQAIGREAGLDPDHVAAAVAEMHLLPDAEPVLVSGVDVTPRRSRVLPVELSDEMWEQYVARLRRTFGTKGVPSQVGRIREWQSQPGSMLHVVAEPVTGGTRITIESSKAAFVRSGNGPNHGLIPALVIAVVMSALFGFGDFEPLVWILPVLITALGVAFWFGMRAHLARWTETRAGQFEALLDQFELIARDPALAPEATPALDSAPAIDLDALGDTPAGQAHDEPIRRRQRG